jgi:translation initiation factor 3 subunit F
VDVQHHQTMSSLHKKVNAREKIVGWFSTGSDVSGSDALIHSFYSSECTSPVHLTVDTALQNRKMAVRAFVSRTLSIQVRGCWAEGHHGLHISACTELSSNHVPG